MRWPWAARPEIRSSYTDLIVAGLFAQADGTTSHVGAIAAVEIASGLWGRLPLIGNCRASLSGLGWPLTGRTVGHRNSALSRRRSALRARCAGRGGGAPACLGLGRERIARPGDLDVSLPARGAKRTISRMVESAGVLHVRYSSDARQPWIGVSPLARCPTTAALGANLETRLSQEAGAPVGSLLAVPESADPDGDVLAGLRTGIAGAKGAPILHETTVKGFGDPVVRHIPDLRPNQIRRELAGRRVRIARSYQPVRHDRVRDTAVDCGGARGRHGATRVIPALPSHDDPAAREDHRNRVEVET